LSWWVRLIGLEINGEVYLLTQGCQNQKMLAQGSSLVPPILVGCADKPF